MRIIENFEGLEPALQGASVALGNFDGVHRGHRALIAAAAEKARALEAPLGVVTFAPHPRRFFQPDAPPFQLTTDAEKARLLEAEGVERLYRLTFDKEFASIPAEDFARGVLAEGLGVRHVAVGADFHFGHRRAGDAAMLRRLGDTLGFQTTIHRLVGDEAGEFASTAIRVMIEQGRCRDAAAQLGRWHAVTGPVVMGDRRGRTLGYPTANLAFVDQLVPRYGIYACRVEVREGPYAGTHDGVASIGERPTFGVNAPNFEVHLFDFDGDLYGAEIAAGLVAWLRGEERFESVEALVAQMDRDSAHAREVLAGARLPEP